MSLIRLRLRSWLASGCTLLLLTAALAPCWSADPGLDDLAGPLRGLALQAAQGQLMGLASAAKAGVTVRGSQVQVEVQFRNAAGAAATGLSSYGATVELRRGQRVQAWVPAAKLAALARLPQVAQIRPVERMIPMQGFGAVTSEGVQLTNASAFHLAGVTGTGAKVAIIDVGFAGLSVAEVPVNPLLPGSIVTFPTGYDYQSSQHGTAVAQIVADMAPDCTLTLIAVGSTLAAESAIDYVAQGDFDIAVMALGTVEGPFDGTHDLALAVNRARQAGVFWINSAGNFAQRHYEGTWRDRNRDAFHEFTTGGQDYVALDLPAGAFDATVSWFETADDGSPGWYTDRDYDLVLTTDASPGQIIAQSGVIQNGDDMARESLRAYVPAAGRYRLRLQRIYGGSTAEFPDKFQLFTPAADMDGQTRKADNSLAIPAEAAGAFAVGASRGSGLPATGTLSGIPIDEIEPFSSRGVANQTTKPAMVAPDSVTTAFPAAPTPGVDNLNPFLGTSAAAAHVAGAAALLLSEDLSRSANALQTLLLSLARPYQNIPPALLNAYGAGRLQLRVGSETDGEAPSIRIEFPRNNSTITIASPRVLATITDNGSIDTTSIQVSLDGNVVVRDGALVSGGIGSNYRFNAATGELQLIINNLTRTRHTVAVQVADTAGNVSDVITSNFRVSTPVITAGLHIISLPYPGLANGDPQDIFGVPLAEIGLARWVPSDSRYSKYHVYPDDYASFAPPDGQVAQPPAGLGYFLQLPRDGVLNISAASVVDSSYNIQLIYGTDPPKGWNLIGNPYEEVVDWGSVEFVSSNGRQDLREAMDPDNSPVTEGVLYRWVSTAAGGYYDFPEDPTQDTLEPLQGYWLHVLKDATLVVHNPGGTQSAARPTPKPAEKPALSAQNWTLQLQARADKWEDPVNYIGVSSRASDGYDAGVDIAEPPPLVDTLRMYYPQRDWGNQAGNYAKDVRSAATGRQEWDVEVACRLTGVPVTISWPRLNATVPKDVELRLVDVDSGASTYMRTSNGYTFQMSSPGIRHLKIVSSSGGQAALTVSGLGAASSGSGAVALTYTVSRDAEVTAEIRNLAGVLIRTVAVQTATAGVAQTLIWNGQSNSGVRVPGGKYFARLTARSHDGQAVQALQPFAVGR